MKIHIKLILIYFLFSFESFGGTVQHSLTPSDTIIQTKVTDRIISIYLPQNYNKNSKYKVIYFNDGQYLFKGGWNLEKQLDSLTENEIIEPIIVVGIHSNENRNSDLIPFNDP